METDVLITGAGITGLSTGWYLKKQGITNFCILEAGSRTGGKISTLREGGFTVEEGPDSLVYTKPWAMELLKELGMEDQVIHPSGKGFYILHNNKLVKTPEGLRFAPSKLMPFLKSPLFTLPGKMRILAEPFLPARKTIDDETLAAFFRRRFGHEMVERYAGPLLSGIYASTAEKLSLLATFPQFRLMEQKHGSISRAMLLQSKKTNGSGELPLFYSLKNGLGSLPEELTRRLNDHIHTEEKITRIEPLGTNGPFRVTTSSGKEYKTAILVITTPGHATYPLLQDWLPNASEVLRKMPYVSTAVVTLAYPRDAIAHPLNGTGFLIPETENTLITSCTWTSSKWPGRNPGSHVLLRCFLGRLGKEVILQNTDEELIRYARMDLKNIMGITEAPEKYWVRRWEKAMPQYFPGHFEKLEAINQGLQQYPFVFMTGANFRGLGVPDCIRQGRETAAEVAELAESADL